jgi:hypothetical protein
MLDAYCNKLHIFYHAFVQACGSMENLVASRIPAAVRRDACGAGGGMLCPYAEF